MNKAIIAVLYGVFLTGCCTNYVVDIGKNRAWLEKGKTYRDQQGNILIEANLVRRPVGDIGPIGPPTYSEKQLGKRYVILNAQAPMPKSATCLVNGRMVPQAYCREFLSDPNRARLAESWYLYPSDILTRIDNPSYPPHLEQSSFVEIGLDQYSLREALSGHPDRNQSSSWWLPVKAVLIVPALAIDIASVPVWAIAAACIHETHTPWKKTSTIGPWCAAEKRADTYTRFAEPFPIPYDCAEEYSYSTRSGGKLSTSAVKAKIDELLAGSEVLASWPFGNVHYGKIHRRKPPFDLYLIAIDPVVLIGVHSVPPTHYGLPPGGRIHSDLLCNLIYVKTEIELASQDSLLLLRADKKGFKTEIVALSSLPTSVLLTKNDYIRITKKNLMLHITRTKTIEPPTDGNDPTSSPQAERSAIGKPGAPPQSPHKP